MTTQQDTISRRNFLRLMAAASSALILRSQMAVPKLALGQQPLRILVVGSGISGIGAARSLQEAGHQVTILEGRDLSGGRTYTSHVWEDLPVDLGAAWFHGLENSPLAEWVDKLGIETLPTDFLNLGLFGSDKKIFSDTDIADMIAGFALIAADIAVLQATVDEDIPLQDALDAVLKDWGASEEERLRLTYLFLTTANLAGADLDEYSLKYWDAVNFDSSGVEGVDLLPVGGYSKLVNAMAEGLDIQLNQVVQTIEYSDAGVKITTSQGTFEADRAVVTVPLGVLKSGAITFSPALPDEKLHAIDVLGMGVINKLFLRFPEIFWDNTKEVISYLTDEPKYWSQIINYAFHHEVPVLMIFSAGDFGRELQEKSDDEIVAEGVAFLRTLYGDSMPDPEAFQITRWGLDPFAYGSYSFQGVNSTPEDHATLGKPVGNVLFFAGEATQDHGAVHNSLLSGYRAAQEIQQGL